MSVSGESMSDTGHNFSCLQDAKHLQCHQQVGPGNVSQLVCSSNDGDGRAALLYTVLVSLSAVIVPLTAVLNLAIVITVLLNRKLHTVINALVTVLGINNLAWAGVPIVMTVQTWTVMPVLCSVRACLFIVTRTVGFIVIIVITVLRYQMVVRNHSYQASTRNVVLFVCIAVLPAVLKWIIRRNHQVSKCNPVIARSPDGFLIVAKFENTFDLLTGIIATLEYGGGILVLAFCYIRILITTVRARRRVHRNGDPPRIANDAKQEDQFERSWLKREWSILRMVRCSRSDTSHQDDVICLESRPGPSRSTGPTTSRKVSSVSQAVDLHRQEHRITYRSRRNIQSACDVPPREEARQMVSFKAFPDVQPPGATETTPNENLITVRSLSTKNNGTSQPPTVRRDSCSNVMLLQPSILLNTTRPPGQLTSRQSTTTPQSRQMPRRPLRQTPGRVDIVATFSMTIFIVILFFGTFSYILSVAVINSRSVCVITAEDRILSFATIIAGMGLSAVVSPLVLVLFSADFRKAFVSTCERAARYFRWSEW